MTLKEFLHEHRLSNAAFGRLTGVSREAVRMWADGERFPSRENMKQIRAASAGMVTANDFVGAP